MYLFDSRQDSPNHQHEKLFRRGAGRERRGKPPEYQA
jgi:hypothetical protein